MVSLEASGRFVLNQRCMHHRASWRLPLHDKTKLPHTVSLTKGTSFESKRSIKRELNAEGTVSFTAEGNIKTHSYVPRGFRSCLNLSIQSFQHLKFHFHKLTR
ncbi:MAG: hypothetical protein ACTS6G_02560 [Candidatus Hodgkinia cicadicola]